MGSDQLEDATAIVTGGASGIGRAITTRFVAAGASVVIADVDERSARDTIEATDGPAAFVETDVTSEADVRELFDDVIDRYDSLDVLVNNAGGSLGGHRLHRLSRETWEGILELNLTGAFLCTRAALEPMIASAGGRLVYVSSINGVTGIGLPAYSAAKAGLQSLSRVVATQYGAHGIRSNVVCPGTIDTASNRERRSEWTDAARDALLDQYPLGRFGTPAEVAEAVLYLASDRSSFVTGTELVVDGGFTAGVDQRLERELYGIQEEVGRDTPR